MPNLNIALSGNPNCGKTSIFNKLTGSNQFVGNWPGVTVERKQGNYRHQSSIKIQDLPGIYSLSPYSPEEIVSRDYLLTDQVDVILNVVDGNNLDRNLYLTTQLMEIGKPMVVAVNMLDIATEHKKSINLDKLSYSLGLPVVEVSGITFKGVDTAIEQCIKVSQKPDAQPSPILFQARLEAALKEVQTVLTQDATIEGRLDCDHHYQDLNLPASSPEETSPISPLRSQVRWHTIKAFEEDPLTLKQLNLTPHQVEELNDIRHITEQILNDDATSIIINERYDFIAQVKQLAVIEGEFSGYSRSDKLDRILTHRILALPIFAMIMWLVYYLSIQTIGGIGTDWLNETFFGQWVPEKTLEFLNFLHVQDWLQSLIIDGILAGIGAVIGFLPQLMMLFFCLALLEDCGYMSRIAFVMDRLFRRFGLSGKSFIPMLIATGCGVPGIMATRTIENDKDRRMTIMLTTFMPCSAKLPIISLIAGAFFPENTWVAPSAYLVGMLAIILSGIALKKTKLFSGQTTPFIMELPLYHFPKIKNVLIYTWDHSKAFVIKASTIIYLSSMVIWFISRYNFLGQAVDPDQSILAVLGNILAPLFAPLGFGNWQAGVAAISGLVAKENVISTFGILYGQELLSENGAEIWAQMRSHYTAMGAYSFLIFNLLCAPCFAAIGAIYREMATLKWTLLAIGYQCALAYLVSFIFYQLTHWWFEAGSFSLGSVIALILTAILIWTMIRTPQKPATGQMALEQV